MTCLNTTTTADAWAAVGAASTAGDSRLVTNQGALAIRVLGAPAQPTHDVGRTVQPGCSLLVPMTVGDLLWVHCAQQQPVVVTDRVEGAAAAATGGGTGDASAAKQDAQTALLTSINMAEAGVHASIGGDGPTPPTIAGTGVRGWLRGIYERLGDTLTVSGTVNANTGLTQPLTDAQLRASPVAVSADYTRGAGNSDANTLRAVLASDGPTVTALASIDTDIGQTNQSAATTDTGSFSIIQLIKRGLQNWTTLLTRIPALVSGRMPVSSSVPTTGSGTILSLTTATTGGSYTAFANTPCIALDIVNNTGTTIEYRRGATGTAMQIPTGSARMVIGITNANQIDIRRTDASNTQVTLQAEAFTA